MSPNITISLSRGLANHTDTPRPLVYITYAKPWYADLNNSELAAYGQLPPLVPRAGGTHLSYDVLTGPAMSALFDSGGV